MMHSIEAKTKEAHGLLCDVRDELIRQQRNIIFTGSILSNEHSTTEKTTGLCEVANKDKLSEVARQLGYALSTIRLLEYLHADTVLDCIPEDEFIPD